jgi:hypothetical protein
MLNRLRTRFRVWAWRLFIDGGGFTVNRWDLASLGSKPVRERDTPKPPPPARRP